jgi:hypothetical protein
MENQALADTILQQSCYAPSTPPKSSWVKYLVGGISGGTVVTFIIGAIIWLMNSAAAQDVSIAELNKDSRYYNTRLEILENCSQKSLEYLKSIDTSTKVMATKMENFEKRLDKLEVVK